MPYITAYNSTDGPVPIDGDGRTLAGRAWGPVLSTEEPVKAALEDGRLIKVARPDEGDLDADAVAAFDATDELNAARGDADAELEAAEASNATPTRRARSAGSSSKE